MIRRLIAALVLGLVAWRAYPQGETRRAIVPLASSVGPDVLVIEHSPTGTVERTGRLIFASITDPAISIEYVVDGDGDAIFHNGFEDVSTCP